MPRKYPKKPIRKKNKIVILQALFLSSYREDVIGGVHMVDATRLVKACVSIWPGVEVFQVFGLHVGHTKVLIVQHNCFGDE